ncbi:hypothetical protein ACFQ08_09495 [Streptosporangium algeriense]|uniref:Uncharacterized protein n=1 Tax=Streptosporangium algeriense TaxID=1682748 RepID=A0ABW3DPQ8_9ACTN
MSSALPGEAAVIGGLPVGVVGIGCALLGPLDGEIRRTAVSAHPVTIED